MPGLRNIQYGFLWLIGALLIYFLSYMLDANVYIVAYGAIFVGIIQLAYGVLQYLGYQAKGSKAKAQVGAEAAVKVVIQSMLYMSTADGDIHENELKMTADVYKKIFGDEVDISLLRDTATEMIKNDFNLDDAFFDEYNMIDDSLKPNILRACYFLAASDGVVSESEVQALGRIASALRMSKEEIIKSREELDKSIEELNKT